MTSDDSEGNVVSKLVSVRGLAALAILGIAILALSRLFGAQTILREVLTEVIAGFGNAILILAIFGLFFRSGLQGVLRRRAPGGERLAESVQRLGEIMHDLDQNDGGMGESQLEARLGNIEEDVKSLVKEVPELKRELKELRRLMLDGQT